MCDICYRAGIPVVDTELNRLQRRGVVTSWQRDELTGLYDVEWRHRDPTRDVEVVTLRRAIANTGGAWRPSHG